jgi:hypothetical protein
MISRRLTRSIAVVAAVIVVGGGAYGIVNATSDSVSGTGTAAPPTPGHVIPFTCGQPSQPRSWARFRRATFRN